MSGRFEIEKQKIKDSGSTLANHSQNQENIKNTFDGYKHFQEPKKATRALSKGERILQKLIEERVQRTESWLTKALGKGYSRVDFPQEISYLKKHGIYIKRLSNTFKN